MDCGNSGMMTIVQEGLDRTERVILEIARCFCRSYSHPESMAWESAFDVSAGAFGEEGAQITHAVMRMLRDMRLSRRSTFRFSNPFCPCCRERMTTHEAKLMRIVRALRSGDVAAARADALILCEGCSEGDLVTSARRLAELVESHPAA